MDPQMRDLYRLEQENNKLLRSLKRQAFWGGLFRLAIYLLAIGIPIWLYFNYLYPVIKQIDATLTKATGHKIQIEGQIAEWGKMYEDYKVRFGFATSSSSSTAQ